MPTSLKRGLLVLCVILGPLFSSLADDFGKDVQFPTRYDRYELLRQEIASIPDRQENSPGAQAMLDFLIQYASERNINWRLYDIEQRGKFHSYGKNISFLIDGNLLDARAGIESGVAAEAEPQTENRFVFFVPYIHSADASNTALIAALLSIVEEGPPRAHIELCFLGSVDKNKGIREYLNRNQEGVPTGLFYLTSHDTLGERIWQENGDEGTISPLWMVQYVEKLLASHNLSSGLQHTQLYRVGLQPSSDLASLLKAEFSTLGLVFRPSNYNSPAITTVSDRAALTFLADLVLTTGEVSGREGWDQHYINFHLGKNRVFITESQYIISFLILLSICFLVILQKRKYKFSLLLFNNLGLLIFLLAGILISLFMGSLMIMLVELLRRTRDLAEQLPLPLLLLKMTTSTVFFIAILSVISRHNSYSLAIPLAKRKQQNFYSIAAVFFLGLNLLIFTTINVNFAHYFLWALLWAGLFFFRQQKIFRTICIILAPLLFIPTFIDALRTTQLIPRLLIPAVDTNLLIALVLMPFVLMLMQQLPLRQEKRQYAVPLLLLPLFIATLIALIADPFTSDNPQQIVISSANSRSVPFFPTSHISSSEDIGGGESTKPFTLTASSKAPIKPFAITLAGLNLSVDNRRSLHEFPSQNLPVELSYEGQRQTFLSRSSYVIELNSRYRTPREISIDLYIGENIPIFNSNLPYELFPGTGRLRFLAGINPPNPLILEFILPANADPRLEVDALYYVEDGYRLLPDDDQSFTFISREKIIFVEREALRQQP